MSSSSSGERLLRERYNLLLPALQRIKVAVVTDLSEVLGQLEHVDAVYGRVKSKASFISKVLRNPEKYDPPFREVEDLIAVRVLVLFPETGQQVADLVRTSVFPPLESDYRHEADPKVFGYEGYQSIHTIPSGILGPAPNSDFPTVFELQIRTLFQHAWIAPDHKINYKNRDPFPDLVEYEYKRKFGWLAASAWGCDQMLQDLLRIYRSNQNVTRQ